MKNNKIKDQNQEAINLFFSCSDNTATQLPAFIFDMLAVFTKTDLGYTDEHRAECVNYFEMLHTLTTNIKPVL